MKKVCVVSGTRAEFGLLKNVIAGIEASNSLQLEFVVTGSHLSPEFGMTGDEIGESGLPVSRRVEMLLSSDSSIGMAKSFGLGSLGFADVFDDIQPDLLLVLGDRFEVFAAAATALLCGIPIAHIHGGEVTEGAIDDAIRHSITKMSSIHFVASESCNQRVLQLGENPDNIFVTGGLGVDAISNLDLMNKNEIEDYLNLKFLERSLLITFHPETRSLNKNADYFNEILAALDSLDGTTLIFTKANADAEGRKINELIDQFVEGRSNAHSYFSLGSACYLSTLRIVDGLVGNSSSGLLEAPTFATPCINIGNRQSGRERATSVLDCAPDSQKIKAAIKKLYSPGFQKILANTSNPYGTPGASQHIVFHLETLNLKNLSSKQFIDMKTTSK